MSFDAVAADVGFPDLPEAGQAARSTIAWRRSTRSSIRSCARRAKRSWSGSASMCPARVTKRDAGRCSVDHADRTVPRARRGNRELGAHLQGSRALVFAVSTLETSPGAAALRSAASAAISSPGSIAASVKSIQK